MARKQDSFYFDTFISCAECAVKASRILRECIDDYNPDVLFKELDRVHEVEHEADVLKHEMMNVLLKAFITPIDREDITLMSQCLDEVVDKLEDVVQRLYCDNIRTIRKEMFEVVDIVEKCCNELLEMMKDFVTRFPNESALKERILNQALREILLMQASDWPFILYNATDVTYAEGRIKEHIENFRRIYDNLCNNEINTEWVINLTQKNNIFPKIDYRIFTE